MRQALAIVSFLFLFSRLSAQTTLVHTSLEKAVAAENSGTPVLALDLSKDKLTDIPEEIREFKSLEKLILNKNKLDSLPVWLKELKHLNYIQADKNLFETFPPVLLEMDSLRVIKLGDNMIDAIPIDIDQLDHLEWLGLWSNVIRDFPASLGDLISLKVLDILYNDMTFEEQSWLKELLPGIIIEMSEPCRCNFDE
jgi:hypothetical protein